MLSGAGATKHDRANDEDRQAGHRSRNGDPHSRPRRDGGNGGSGWFLGRGGGFATDAGSVAARTLPGQRVPSPQRTGAAPVPVWSGSGYQPGDDVIGPPCGRRVAPDP